MRLFIVLAALISSAIAQNYDDNYYQYNGPQAPLSSDGMVMDTPEVAHARAAHMAMHAEAMARLKKAQNDYEEYDNSDVIYMPQIIREPMVQKRQRQRLFDSLEQDTRDVDPPAMTEAKTVRTATHTRAASKATEFYEFDVFDGRRNLIYLAPVHVSYKRAPTTAYRGPFAPLSPDGRVVDTPEVARAREAHMKAHARAVAMSTQNDLYY